MALRAGAFPTRWTPSVTEKNCTRREKLGHSACSQPACAGKDWCITHPIGQRCTDDQPTIKGQTSARSPGVSSVAFRAPSPGLRFASLMDMDFAVSGPLVRRSRLVPGSCPSTRTFAPRFLQTSPRGDSPCVFANPSPPSGWVEDFHLQATEHAQHTTKSLRDNRS